MQGIHVCRIKAQAEVGGGRVRKKLVEQVQTDHRLPAWVSVIAVDARNGALPICDGDGVTGPEVFAPGKLFVNQRGLSGGDARPYGVGLVDQRPVLGICGVVGDAEDLCRRAGKLRLGGSDRQDRVGAGAR